MKNNFWTFSDEQKSMFVAQTSERVGLPPQAVEKDWWVTMTLKALFESSCRDFITFKGLCIAVYNPLKRRDCRWIVRIDRHRIFGVISYFAYATDRVSRMTVIFTCPG